MVSAGSYTMEIAVIEVECGATCENERFKSHYIMLPPNMNGRVKKIASMLRQLIVNGALLLLTNSIALHTLFPIWSGPFYIVTVAVAAVCGSSE